MQKIKLDVFKSWLQKDLTGNEIDFLITLSFYQNDRGCVHGVYYKEMMEESGIGRQSFYDCIHSLEDKGVISVRHIWQDYDIQIIGNDFSEYTDQDYKDGNVKYIRMNAKLFHSASFRVLKAKVKLLVMDLYRIQTAGKPRNVQATQISREKFYKKYANEESADGTVTKGLLNITRRTLQKYLKLARLFFSICLKDGKYFFTLRKYFGEKSLSAARSEDQVAMEHLLNAACRRNRIKTPEQYTAEERQEDRRKYGDCEREYKDLIKTFICCKKEILTCFVDVTKVMEDMLRTLNTEALNPHKWKRRLKASLFRKLLNEAIA